MQQQTHIDLRLALLKHYNQSVSIFLLKGAIASKVVIDYPPGLLLYIGLNIMIITEC